MLKRICDRCCAEIPVEQMMEDGELILRKINGKPYDLCPDCQNDLKSWFTRRPCVYLDNVLTDTKIMCGVAKAERFDVDDKREDNAE